MKDDSTLPSPASQQGRDRRSSILTNEPNFLRFIRGRRESMTSAALGYDDDYNAALTKAVAKFMEEPSAPEPLCRLDTIMTENEDPS